MFKKLFPLFILLFGFGSLLFSQDVNSSGAFTYSYPINIPPGTNGMAPQLSLDYNSQAGNGMVGMGWNLSGFQTITRDSTYDIKWDNSDHFLLNGQRLIPDGSVYNYRTENESFLKIQYIEHLYYWVVTQKNGTKYFFGNSDKSRIEAIAVGRSAPRVWALNKVIDVHGNYYTIEYDEDTKNGDYYPIKIVYTMNDNGNLQEFREVVFTYEGRDDHWITYNPSQNDMDKRLQWITVNVGGNLLRKYELKYNDLNSVADRSKLKSIQEYGSDGQVLPETKIEWQPFSNGYSDAITIPKPAWLEDSYINNTRNNFLHSTPDINGDGLADILFKTEVTPSYDISYEVSLSNDDNYKPAYHVLGCNGKEYMSYLENKDKIADVNGDGRDDILIPETDENYIIFKICLSDGDVFKKEKVWLKIDIDYYSFATKFTYMSDVNGDGLVDLLFYNFSKRQLQVCFSTGDGFKIGPTIDYYCSGYYQPILIADINGDGRSDIIIRKEYKSRFGKKEIERWWKAYIFTGTEFELYKPADWTISDDGWTEITKKDYRGFNDEDLEFTIVETPDINGDGFADLLFFEHREKQQYKIRLSTGSGFTEEIGYRHPYDYRDFLFSIDTNGDGRKDLLKDKGYTPGKEKIWGIKPSTGSFFHESLFYIYQKNTSTQPGNINYSNRNFMIRPLDYNGDGSTDLLTKHYNYNKKEYSLELYRSNYSKDLISSITLPNGAKISPVFTPAPQVPNAICPNDSSYPYVSNKSTRPLVTSLIVSDGMGNNYESTYDYYNGKTYIGHSRFENKSMGFEWTKKKNHDGTYAKTYYYQEEKLLYAGAIMRIENYGSDELLYTATENKYITKQIKSSTGTHSKVSIGQRCITMPVEPSKDGYHGVYSIQKSDSYQYNFNGVGYTDWETVKGLPGILKIRTSYRYDSWGNAIRVVNYGELGNDSDNSVTTTKYIHDETTNISVPQYTESHSFGLNEEEFDSALLEEEETLASFQEFFYDGSTVSGDIGAKGELSRKITYSGFTKEEDLKKYPNLITNYEYDIYGNIETIIDGNGNKTTISYDDNYNTLLKSKINALGQIVETIKYDDFMKPQYSYDINNKQTRYTYDSFGRYVRTYGNIFERLEDQAPTEVQLSYTFHSDDPASPGNPICTETGSFFLTNPNKYIETYTYSNGLGQKLQEKTEGVDKNDDPVWITTD
ncbi:MAG: hypothetical protein GY760_20245, partial [Deltaproteobacteria bacterium]|nr:hypothetical protein [Deltaproteobacteria bacterium]